MIKNYLILAWRNLVRNRLSSIINIGGLSVGLAVSIVLMLWIERELSVDKFHAHIGNIYRVMVNQQRDEDIHTGNMISGAVAPLLRENMPGLQYIVRTSQDEQQLIRVGDKSLYIQGLYTEPDYFNMMSFPAVAGNPVAALRDAGTVVITEATAQKLFGKEDPMGKVIVHNNVHALKVGAVIRDLPDVSSEHFGMVLPFSLFEKENDWVKRWDYNALETWVQVKPGVNVAGLNKKLKGIMGQHGEKTSELFVYPFERMHLHGQFRHGYAQGGKITVVVLMGALGAFVLLLACINFMNLATARSEYRAREVGVRKTLGASRGRIIFQFLGEAFVMTALALLLAVTLAAWFLPIFSRLAHVQLHFDVKNVRVWGSILGIGAMAGLLAGSYPAFFLSSFRPVTVLKGPMVTRKGGSWLRKGLVTFQFMISVFLIIGTLVFYLQVHHLETRPIGSDLSNLIDVPARGDMSNKFELVKNELVKIPGIQSVSGGSDNVIHMGGATDGLGWPNKRPDQNFMVWLTWVSYDWVKTAGVRLAEGRDFSPAYGADTNACLLNQEAVRRMGLKAPVIGTKIGNSTVIGVVENYIFNDPSRDIRPLLINLSRGSMSNILVRLQNDASWHANIERISQAVKKIDPDYPFEFHFIKEDYERDFKEVRAGGALLNIVGGIAITISCLGLFALSAFLTERRTKEIGIRKVLGASVGRVWFLLTREFLGPVLVACVIIIPIALWSLSAILQTMDYRIELSWWIFAAGGLLAIFVAVATVSFQGIRAAVANPVKALRTE